MVYAEVVLSMSEWAKSRHGAAALRRAGVVSHRTLRWLAVLGTAAALAHGCAGKPRPEPPPPPRVETPPSPAPPLPPVVASPAPAPTPPPPAREVFESPGFIVAFAKPGDTAEGLAARHLGGAERAWMIEDWMGGRSFAPGQVVVIPREQWTPAGVVATGYQLVPILVYHNVAAQRRGGRNDLTIAAATFEAQMRYLKSEGYRTVGLRDFLDFTAQRRQLPTRSVLLAFDDNYRGFLQYAHPILRELGFTATLFVPTDQVGTSAKSPFLTWQELAMLAREGFDVQAHSKTHGNLRRRSGESGPDHARRMDAELGQPQALFEKHLEQRSASVAYPYGDVDDEVMGHVQRHGYVRGFTVHRQANPAFAPPLQLHRSQVYGEWSLTDFTKNLNTFHREDLRVVSGGAPQARDQLGVAAKPDFSPDRPGELVAFLCDNARAFERNGELWRALAETRVALTVDVQSQCAAEIRRRLEGTIDRAVTDAVRSGQAAQARVDSVEAQRSFLKALALEPSNQIAFKALQTPRPTPTSIEGRFISHRVRQGETLEFLAELYYGDRSRGELLAKVNGLPQGRPLVPGRDVKIPEIPGVPILRPDR